MNLLSCLLQRLNAGFSYKHVPFLFSIYLHMTLGAINSFSLACLVRSRKDPRVLLRSWTQNTRKPDWTHCIPISYGFTFEARILLEKDSPNFIYSCRGGHQTLPPPISSLLSCNYPIVSYRWELPQRWFRVIIVFCWGEEVLCPGSLSVSRTELNENVSFLSACLIFFLLYHVALIHISVISWFPLWQYEFLTPMMFKLKKWILWCTRL